MSKYIYIITMKNSNFSGSLFDNSIQEQVNRNEYVNNISKSSREAFEKYKYNSEVLFFESKHSVWFVRNNDAIEIG